MADLSAPSDLPAYDDSGDLPDYGVRPPTDPTFRAIMGTAGTGKTWQMHEEAKKYDDVLLCATSGIAAVNLGGTTINSLLWYYDLASLRTAYELGKLNAALMRIANSRYRRVAVDEMSMMDGAQLDILMMAFDEVNTKLTEGGKEPIGMTLLGDFCQLPPVGWGEAKKDYAGRPLPPVTFCFERPSWERFGKNVTLLTEPKRQDDAAFIGALQAIRRGDAMSAMGYFNGRIDSVEDPQFDGTTILAKNDEVDRHNRMRLNDLPGDLVSFPASKSGEQLGEWKYIPDVLTLKREALVMILVNRREKSDGDDDPGAATLIYANGDLAYFIEDLERATPMRDTEGRLVLDPITNLPRETVDLAARVRLKRNGHEVLIPMTERQKVVATGNVGEKAPRNEVKGSIQYMPLRLAYATTVHKSQGLSLDNVQVMFMNHFFTHPSMLYVALSRARSVEGLRLVGNMSQFVRRCRTNPAVARWL